jgi:hypothetical protein
MLWRLLHLEPCRQGLNIDHLRRLTSPGRLVTALVNDPDPKLAEDLARETLATDGLKLIFLLSTADAAPAPSFGLDARVQSLTFRRSPRWFASHPHWYDSRCTQALRACRVR